MKTVLTNTVMLILAGISFVSCKKNDGSSTCHLKTAHIILAQYDATTKLDYDGQGRIAVATTTGTANKTNTFTYQGDTTTILETTSSSSVKKTVVKNSNGHIKDLIIRNSAGVVSILVHYDYNGAGKVIKQTTTYGSGTPLVYVIAYNGAGDAITETNQSSGSSSIYNEYFTDQAYQTGDGESISDFLNYGATAVTNNHLIKTNTSTAGTAGPTITSYVYSFDNSGNIITMTQTIGTSPSTYDYTYACD